MELWQKYLLSAGGLLLLAVQVIRSAVRKHREYQYRDALRKLELVLLPRESIKVICPQRKGRVILTSRRVLFEGKDRFHAVVIKSIKKVQGINEKGNRTTSIPKMVRLTILAEQEYTVKNESAEFSELAKQLIKKTAKKPKGKKESTK